MYFSFPDTDIYALTDSRQSLGRSTPDVARQMLAAGIKVIQYREKDKSAGEMLRECLIVRELTRRAGCCFLVNDHVDVALACDADGVHVGQDDLPVPVVRGLLGGGRVIGVSTHSREQAEAALRDGADYIGVGPIFPTATKSTTPAVGFAYLTEISADFSIPFVTIGGVNERTLPGVLRHGARCCGIVSAITSAPDIPAEIARLRAVMRECAAEKETI